MWVRDGAGEDEKKGQFGRESRLAFVVLLTSPSFPGLVHLTSHQPDALQLTWITITRPCGSTPSQGPVWPSTAAALPPSSSSSSLSALLLPLRPILSHTSFPCTPALSVHPHPVYQGLLPDGECVLCIAGFSAGQKDSTCNTRVPPCGPALACQWL